MRWAIINPETGVVENIIIWDGSGELYPYQNNQLVSLAEGEWCDMGALYAANDNPRFSPAPVVTVEEV